MNKIVLSHVGKQFRKVSVLKDVCLELNPGNIYGFVGPNGCGKTVLLKLISGLLYASEGEILVDSKRIGKDLDFPPSIGILIENPGFLPSYTGLQNLMYLARIKRLASKKEVLKSMEQVGIAYAANQKVGKYSLGMKQRLGIAQAIMEDPEVIILDEPMNGLDQQGVEEIRELLLTLRQQNKLILLASHTREDIRLLCNYVYYIKKGQTILQEIHQE